MLEDLVGDAVLLRDYGFYAEKQLNLICLQVVFSFKG